MKKLSPIFIALLLIMANNSISAAPDDVAECLSFYDWLTVSKGGKSAPKSMLFACENTELTAKEYQCIRHQMEEKKDGIALAKRKCTT